MNETVKCLVCGEPMPAGEEMFNYHGYSGPCPKPPMKKEQGRGDWTTAVLPLLAAYRADHRECRDLTGHPDAMPSQRKDWRCDNCKAVDELTSPTSPASSQEADTK